MTATIQTAAAYTTETRRNLFTEPRPAVAGNWSSFNITRSMLSNPTDGLYAHGVTTSVNTYWTPANSLRPSISPGEVVTAQVEVRGDISSAYLRLLFYNAAGALISSVNGEPIVPSSGWQRTNVTAVAPEGSVLVGFWVLGIAVAGNNFDIRRVSVEKIQEVSDYFDGDTLAVAGYSYAWAGAANASESIEYLTAPRVFTPELVDGFQAARPVRNIVHEIMDRADPDVTLRAAGLRRGTFRCLFRDQAAALAAYAGLSVPEVFTISDPAMPAIGMTFVVGPEGDEIRLELDTETRRAWWLVVPFVEVLP